MCARSDPSTHSSVNGRGGGGRGGGTSWHGECVCVFLCEGSMPQFVSIGIHEDDDDDGDTKMEDE